MLPLIDLNTFREGPVQDFRLKTLMDPGIPHKELRRFLDHPRPSVPDPALPSI